MSGTDFEAIGQAGAAALQRGDAAAARRAFATVTQAGAATAQSWLLLARACAMLGDGAGEASALEGALALEPRNLLALLASGDRAAVRGDDRAAGSFYQLALTNAPDRPTAAVAAQLGRAAAAIEAASARYEAHLGARLSAAGFDQGARAPRMVEALDIMTGRKQRYEQQPTSFYYPGLPNIAFFEREAFGWLGAIETQVPAMRAELEAVIADDERGFRPYVEPQPGRPNRGHALLGDPRWSAFHLMENGAVVEANATRCPATMAALAKAPIPKIAGRSPMALFSVLRARTHIPPHSGMLNTRLIVHVPLIVPDKCRLRVGNEIRTVEPGKALIFDDSIQHEAWNDSDETRVVLLFEIWRPELSADERAQLTVLFEAIGSYPGG